MRIFSFFLLGFLSLSGAAAAFSGDLKGLALVRIRSKHIPDMTMDQAVFLRGGEARFVALDDFGGVAFAADFAAGQVVFTLPDGSGSQMKDARVKRLLSLPLSRDEFLAVVRHERPADFTSCRKGEAEVWTKPGEKKMEIRFEDFMTHGAFKGYPRRIRITQKKNLFELTWRNMQAL